MINVSSEEFLELMGLLNTLEILVKKHLVLQKDGSVNIKQIDQCLCRASAAMRTAINILTEAAEDMAP